MEADIETDKSNTKDNKNNWRVKSKCNLLYDIFMCWIFPIVFKAYKRDLQNDDLMFPKQKYSSKEIAEDFERFWSEEIKRATIENKKPSLGKALTRAYSLSYIPSILFILVNITARTMQPIVFSWLLSYWSVESTTSQKEASYYAMILIAITMLGMLCQHHNTFFLLLRLSQLSLSEISSGKLINLLSNDMAKFDNGFTFLSNLFIIPIQVVVILYYLYESGGYAPFVGLFGVICLIFPLQVILIKLSGYLRHQTAQRTDQRLKIINEIIDGIQIIKMYAWEKPFETVVRTARFHEMKWLRKFLLCRSVFVGFSLFTERSMLFFAILTFVFTGTLPVGTMIYPIQQFFNIIQMSVGLVAPLAIANFTEMMVSLKRIEKFLLIDEKGDISTIPKIDTTITVLFNNTKPVVIHDGIIGKISLQKNNSCRSIKNKTEVLIEMSRVCASWKNTSDNKEMTLSDISLQFLKNRIYAIVGRVGAGKSSLLQIILKELPVSQGQLIIDGKISYGSQEPWLFPTTIRENILFGLPYDVDKYTKVCQACALISDFSQFPYKDLSLVGERGLSLSGGQKARITLARTMYREADVYLLDDPMSSVDTKVGKQLFKECIKTYLHGRTCILVTHQHQYLKEVDEIFIIDKGSIKAKGTYDELINSEKTSYLLQLYQTSKNNDIPENDNNLADKYDTNIKSDIIVESANVQVMQKEKSAIGQMKWNILYQYLCSVKSWWIIFGAVSSFLVTQFVVTMTDYFLSFWTNQVNEYMKSLGNDENPDINMNIQIGLLIAYQYMLIYGSLILLLVIISNIRIFAFIKMTMQASGNLHDTIFKSLASTTMRFLDTNHSGRILNRFSSDIGAMDEQMPRCLLETIQMYLTIISVFVLTAIALPWTLIPTGVFAVILFYIFKWYLIANQTVKRMDSTTKSPMFSLVTSTMSGLPTIRSLGLQSVLLRDFYDAQDLNSIAFYTFLSGISAFSLYLDLLCLTYLGAIITFFIIFDFGDAIPIGYVGMAVSQAMMIAVSLRIASRYTADFLGHTIAVERILEYTKLPTEDNLSDENTQSLDKWPSGGHIEFENLFFKYSEHDTPVLKNLSFEIKSGWKVGVVGRTGAGKSSLISALFRLYFIEGGIKIDGINTKDVTKKELRSKISIIPQQPVLFSETVRYNLDPFNNYSDDCIWKALEQVELKDVIPALDYKVSEGGSNFSMGQRQLLCLARAILRSNKVLVMDEATANVDYQTDELIQKTIRREFALCTVITIAHRLNTIMDSDRVLVMDKGTALEFDHPYLLMSNPNSVFTSLVKETGDNMSKEFLEIAKTKYRKDSLTV